MGMQNPTVREPLDKLAEVYPEGTPFYLTGIRTVKAQTQDFGEGEMVVLTVRGHDRELGVWGAYLLAQAKSVDDSDLNRWYRVERITVEGFGKGRPVKAFVPAVAPAQQTMTDADRAAAIADRAADDDPAF